MTNKQFEVKEYLSQAYYYEIKIDACLNELERIRAALHDADIPYSYQEARRDTGIQILNSAPPENCDVFVPLSAYNDALEVLIGIGALKENDIPDIDDENKGNV